MSTVGPLDRGQCEMVSGVPSDNYVDNNHKLYELSTIDIRSRNNNILQNINYL